MERITVTLVDGKIETEVEGLQLIAVIAILEAAKLNAIAYWQKGVETNEPI